MAFKPPQKEVTKSNILTISNIPPGSQPSQLWTLFSVLCGDGFLCVRQLNAETCIAVFKDQDEARLAQKALEFIIFKNHILQSKGFENTSQYSIIPSFVQLSPTGAVKKTENFRNVITTKQESSIKQLANVTKLRRQRMDLIQSQFNPEDDYM